MTKAVQEWRTDPEVREAARLAILQHREDAAEIARLLTEAGDLVQKVMSGPLGRQSHDTFYEARWKIGGLVRNIGWFGDRSDPNETYIGNVAAFNGDLLCPDKGWPPPPPSDPEDW